MRKIVAIGGGTGLASIRKLLDCSYDVTAICGVCDDGTSSGRLRAIYDSIVPPGDYRKSISYFTEPEIAEILEYRFDKRSYDGRVFAFRDLIKSVIEETELKYNFEKLVESSILESQILVDELNGHALGNLLLVKYMQRYGNSAGIQKFAKAMKSKVEFYPISDHPSTLKYMDFKNETYTGEHTLDDVERESHEAEKIWLDPEISANNSALEKIRDADTILFVPTSIVASIISVLLVKNVKETLNGKRIIWIGPIMTERNKSAFNTQQYNGFGHVEKLKEYLGRYPNDAVVPVFEDGIEAEKIIHAYRREGAFPVLYRENEFTKAGIAYHEVEGLMTLLEIEERGIKKQVFRHNPDVLARAIDSILKSRGA